MMETEMKLSLVRRAKRPPRKSLLDPSKPKEAVDKTENKSSTEPCKENMMTITVLSWKRSGTSRYHIYVPKDASVADLEKEFAEIYLVNSKCRFTNNHFGNAIWSGELQLKMFAPGSDYKLYLMLDRGAVFREKVKSTEWNPIKK
ncbi:hypothetical protein LPJ57_006980 [Coemansia sp. RSA 486]|nr:hypothetical protein LPJ57_006980 [Coemansia sp. RSA 486]